MSSPAQAPGMSARRYAFDEFELELDAFELRRDGVAIAVEPQVLEVLAVLVEGAGRVVTKDELFDRVWPERYVSEAALNSRVMSARKALGDSGRQQRYIKTVHGRGYRFLGTVVEPRDSVVIPFPGRAEPRPPASQPATRFIGRSEELSALRRLLAQDDCRLLTICGPGGAGKTRLLRELHDAGPADLEAWYASLEHAVAGTLAAAVAREMGAQAGSGAPLDQILRAIGPRPAVLYLDNIELLTNEARGLFRELLERAPGLRIVCTSRVALSIQREWLFRVNGMSADDAQALFLDRSARARPGSPATDDEQSVRAICEATGYLPLAVELAAGLTAYLEPRDVLAQVLDDPACLVSPLRDVPDRHRSLVSLFEESCSRLSEADRVALTACAVFEGPFEASAARAVAGCLLEDIRPLVDSSLLQATGGRFAMHPLLRQLARASGGEAIGRLEAAHGEYFMERLAAAAPALEGRDQLATLEALSADHPNIAAAWRWAVAAGRLDLVSRAQRGLFACLVPGHYAEGDSLAAAAAAAARDAGELPLLAGMLVHRSWFLLRLGRVDEAADALTEATAISRSLELPWRPGYGADPRLATAMFRLGAGDYPRASHYAERAYALGLAAGDRAGAAYACWLAGMAHLRQSRLICEETGARVRYSPAGGDTGVAEAARYIAEARALLPEGEHYLTGAVAVEAGLQHEYLGDHAAAQAEFRRAYALRAALGDARGMGYALFYLADVLLNDARATEAEELLVEAEALFRRLGDASGMAEVTRVRGLARLAAGDVPGAREALTDSLRRSLALGFANNIAGLMRSFSQVVAAEGDLERSADILRAVAADASTTPASVARTQAALARLASHGITPAEAGPSARELAAEVIREADLAAFHERVETAV